MSLRVLIVTSTTLACSVDALKHTQKKVIYKAEQFIPTANADEVKR